MVIMPGIPDATGGLTWQRDLADLSGKFQEDESDRSDRSDHIRLDLPELAVIQEGCP